MMEEEILNNLINSLKEYNKKIDNQKVEKAYEFAKKYYESLERPTGVSTLKHALEVAQIIVDMKLDEQTIIASILHECLKNKECSIDLLKHNFGEEISSLIDGSTKLYMLNYDGQKDMQVENWRKMFMAIARDVRVVIIKLADRLNNMREIKNEQPSANRLLKAKETLEVYAPIAHRLGIQSIKWELEDISMIIISPDEYMNLKSKVSEERQTRQEYINQKIEQIRDKLKSVNIKAHIEGRPKHFYSIYKKMIRDNKSIDEIYDLLAIRVMVDNVQECYVVLGIIHELFKPMPGRFKDYICNPKTNMYQSLHTTVFGEKNIPFEIQIRTWEMHNVADYGIAAHFLYKEGKNKMSDADKKLTWIKQTIELQSMLEDSSENIKDLNVDLFGDEVFVFTPKGDIVNLPDGSVGIDFAYAIHGQVGNKMIGIKINGEIQPITTKLKNGDIVSVMTSDNSKGPSYDWIKIVKSAQAKSKIQQWFKKEKRDEYIQKGKELIEKELKKEKIEPNEILIDEYTNKVVEKYSYHSIDDCYASIGYGGISVHKVMTKLLEEYNKNNGEKKQDIDDLIRKITSKKKTSYLGVKVKDLANCLIKLAKCCNPLPGDEIVGYVSIGKGVSVHKKDCPNVKGINLINERQIEVEWENQSSGNYKCNIVVEAYDRTGLVYDITKALAEQKISLLEITTRVNKDKVANTNISVQVNDVNESEKIMNYIRNIDGVFNVRRGR